MNKNEIENFLKNFVKNHAVEINSLNVCYSLDEALKQEKDIYFLWWVEDKNKMKRNLDDWIVEKNSFYIDLDIRENNNWKITNEEIISYSYAIEEILKDKEYFSEWKYIIYTWNWLHVYYVWDFIDINKELYSLWVNKIYEKFWDIFSREKALKPDFSCKNIGRIARLPWTKNYKMKEKRWLDPLETEIILEQDIKSRLVWFINRFWEVEKEKKEIEQSKNKSEHESILFKKQLQNNDWSVYESICNLPLNEIICADFWFKQWNSIRYFYLWDEKSPKWLRYNDDNNTVYHWWSTTWGWWEIWKTYNAFWYIREREKLNSHETFEFCKKKYPSIWELDKKQNKNTDIIPKRKYNKIWYVYPSKVFDKFDCMMSWELVTVVAESNSWKSQPLYSKILTPKWWTTMWEIKIWDFVVWIDWKPKKVLGFPSFWEQKTYKLTMSDGTECCAWEHHEFRIRYSVPPNKNNKNWRLIKWEKDVEVKDILLFIEKWYRVKLCKIKPLLFSTKKELKIDPYTLWVLIWDWCLWWNSIMISSVHNEILDNLVLEDCTLKHINKWDYRISSWYNWKWNKILSSIKNMWLNVKSDKKFIPDDYLMSSKENRLSLLQWLMDTDWEMFPSNKPTCTYKYAYSTTSKQLYKDIVMLIKSLWWACNVLSKVGKYKDKDNKIVICKRCYNINFSIDINICVFKYSNKQRKVAPPKKICSIKKIEYVWIELNKCISVEDEMYITDNMIPTHNTTFAMDIIESNSKIGKRWFYINLEFPIETMWQNRWLFLNWKKKRNLTDLDPLSNEDQIKMDNYIKKQLWMFDYCNYPQWIELNDLINIVLEKENEWYKLFVIDSFSRIHGNLNNEKARTSQNKCMEKLQELVQNIWIVILNLHHTNKKKEFEWSQKIMDLSNVFISIIKEEDMNWLSYRTFSLSKDKYITKTDLEISYQNQEYIEYWW